MFAHPNSTSTKVLTPYERKPDPILKKIHADGSASYHEPHTGSEIVIRHYDLEHLFNYITGLFRNLVDLMNDDALDTFGNLLEATTNDAEAKFEEAEELIRKRVGKVMLISRVELTSQFGRLIDAELLPPDEG